MSGIHRIDRKAAWCVHRSVKAFSPLIIGSALLLGAGACGGKDKKATGGKDTATVGITAVGKSIEVSNLHTYGFHVGVYAGEVGKFIGS